MVARRECCLASIMAHPLDFLRALAGQTPVATLSDPGRDAANDHASNQSKEEMDEKWQLDGQARIARLERVKRERCHRTVGDRQYDEENRQGHHYDNKQDAMEQWAGPSSRRLGVREVLSPS